jgi:phosphatidylserine/phosphatidylglycerophosphate/cardiolipin synthase-like enzyme
MSVDIFSYDLDEPDIIRKIAAMGARARVIQDDSAGHIKKGALEPDAIEAFRQAGVAVKTGHFRRFAHDKIMIQKKTGKAVKVLTGSMNFSIRGIYVQANSVVIFDNPQIANLYEQAFEQAFTDMDGFRSSDIASKWFDVTTVDTSSLSLSFAPHKTAFTVNTVSEAIESAKSSVLFAVMEMQGGGPVMPALENLGARDDLFSLGTVDTESQLKLFKKGVSSGVTSKGWLKETVPAPFKSEVSGGMGHVIHHKFVVCDFNDRNPVVFCGSSNLAAGGETDNGDNLIAIHHPDIVYSYAVEAIRLYDHYEFRGLHEHSTSNKPLTLDMSDSWVKPYYDPNHIKFHERKLYSMSSVKGYAPR